MQQKEKLKELKHLSSRICIVAVFLFVLKNPVFAFLPSLSFFSLSYFSLVRFAQLIFCFLQALKRGVCFVCPSYLENSEKNLPPPSIRLALNCLLSHEDIINAANVLSEAVADEIN